MGGYKDLKLSTESLLLRPNQYPSMKLFFFECKSKKYTVQVSKSVTSKPCSMTNLWINGYCWASWVTDYIFRVNTDHSTWFDLFFKSISRQKQKYNDTTVNIVDLSSLNLEKIFKIWTVTFKLNHYLTLNDDHFEHSFNEWEKLLGTKRYIFFREQFFSIKNYRMDLVVV